ncbi:MAG: ferritin-like domain-containing protein [Candidatus Micrarchaeia archaeon]|jgi:bacterioferritin
MAFDKKKMAALLNKALTMEHQADLQYLTHAAVIQGINVEPIISRLREIAKDEEGHAAKLRERIADGLGETPTMEVAKTYMEADIEKVLRLNLKFELEAISTYRAIHAQIPREEFLLEHEVRHILQDEMRHVEELKLLLGEL